MLHRFRRQMCKQAPGCPAAMAEEQTSDESGKCLTQVGNGCTCRIRRHRAHGAIRQRLLDLGFVPGVEVEMIRCATLGDPLELRLGDYYVTLRRREAELIDVKVA